jgi:hypothetical protein
LKTKLIHFPDSQVVQIQTDADAHEISFTEMVRRIVDRHYEEKQEKLDAQRNNQRQQ